MSHHEREVIGVDDRVSPARAIPLGIQHMMSMFGSTVLVPVLTGLDPNVAIMCSGIGTICYLLVTGNKIPSYLGNGARARADRPRPQCRHHVLGHRHHLLPARHRQ